MEKETKHTPEALWEKMAREDWLAGEGFSGKFNGLSRVPHIFKPRIFEFAESYSASLQTELSEMKKENEDCKKLIGMYSQAAELNRDSYNEMKKEREELIGVLNNLVEANPGDSTWNYPAAFDAAISLLNRINKTTNG